MDILDSLTFDFDRLHDLTIELALSADADRERTFRKLVRLQDVSLKAQMAAMDQRSSDLGDLEFAKRKMLERADIMQEITSAIFKTSRQDLREAKMDLYSDLVLQRITESEREILPALFDRLDDSDRAKLSGIYESYKDCALLPQAV